MLSKTTSLGLTWAEMQKMQKTTPSTTQIQKTLPLVVHDVVKNNFTAGEISRNGENAENDTLTVRSGLGRGWTEMHKMYKTTPFAAQMQKTLPLVIQNAVKDNFTWADMSRSAGNAENDTLCCTNAENPSPSHTERYQRQLHLGWHEQKCKKFRKRHPLLYKCSKPFP